VQREYLNPIIQLFPGLTQKCAYLILPFALPAAHCPNVFWDQSLIRWADTLGWQKARSLKNI
jgi:hypothetical protein